MDEVKAGIAGASERGLALASPPGLLRQIEGLASPWALVDAAAHSTCHRSEALRQVTVALNQGVASVPIIAGGRAAGRRAAGERAAEGGAHEAVVAGPDAARGAGVVSGFDASRAAGGGRSAAGGARAILQRLGAAATGLRGWMGPVRVPGAPRAAGPRAGRLDAVSAAPVLVVDGGPARADPLRADGAGLDALSGGPAWTMAAAPADWAGGEDRGADPGALPPVEAHGGAAFGAGIPNAVAPVLVTRMRGAGDAPGLGDGGAVAPGFEAFVAALGRDTGSSFSGARTIGSSRRAPFPGGDERLGGGAGHLGDGGSGGGRPDGGREEIALVELDGRLVGSILSERMAREAARPGAGMTGFDARQAPAWTPSGSV